MNTNRSTIERVGIVSAVLDLRLRDLVWPEGTLAAILTGGAAYLTTVTTHAERHAAVNAELNLSAAFVAVVFAALAIVVSLPSSSYLRMLAETPGGGMWQFLAPFLITLGAQIAAVVGALAYTLMAAHVRLLFEQVSFTVIAFLFAFGLLDLAALGRQLVKHGILRAHDAVLAAEIASRRQAG